MPPDAIEMEAECAAGSPAKGGKARLLALEDLDRRTSSYRKTAELIDRVEADLGGSERLSAAERQIVRHAALTSAMLEDLGVRWLGGEPIDPSMFATLSNSERRLYETVGLKRQPRDVMTLQSYLAARAEPPADGVGARSVPSNERPATPVANTATERTGGAAS
jgi:hypothetical protein